MKIWTYRHYKWKNYEVIWVARHSDTLEEFVVYKALYDSEEFGDGALRVKPVQMFQEEISIDWIKTERFKYIW